MTTDNTNNTNNTKIFVKDKVPESGLVDSGSRLTFSDAPNSAMREPTQGNGRGELLPLGEIIHHYELTGPKEKGIAKEKFLDTLKCLHYYKQSLDDEYLNGALCSFCAMRGWSFEKMFIEIAKQSEAGAIKYADNNYAHGDGIPVSNYIGHAIIHLLKYYDNQTDEPHDRAFCWNIITCLWTLHNKKDCNDLAVESLEMYENNVIPD